MLVHSNNEKGVLCYNGMKIYGWATNMPPTDLPYKVYEELKEAVQHATYREGYLLSHFPGPFPELAFRYNEVRWLPQKTLHAILDGMQLEYDAEWPSKRKVEIIKTALRDVTPS
jgi:hypothetical protein